MKNNGIINAWNKITPGEEDESRMLEHILKNNKKLKSSKILQKRNIIFTTAAACLLLCLAIGRFLNNEENITLNNNTIKETADTAMEKVDTAQEHTDSAKGQTDTAALPVNNESTFNGFVLTAYTSKEEGTYLSNDYRNDMTATMLKPEVKVLLAAYNPLMSSVPGLPFTFSLSDESDVNSTFSLKITVDNGELLTWDTATGIVTTKGTEVSCQSGETLYWSPLSAEGSQNPGVILKAAQITVTAIKDEKEIGRQIIYVTERNGNYYAEIGELIQL